MPFYLKKYKEELGKDYKRIILYLLSVNDKLIAGKCHVNFDEHSSSSDDFMEEPPLKKKCKEKSSSPSTTQEENDELFARELQEMFNDDIPQYIEELPQAIKADVHLNNVPCSHFENASLSDILTHILYQKR